MSYINFRPWVGKNYKTGLFNGKKILVLGESHYCENSCNHVCSKNLMGEGCRNQTNDVIVSIKTHERRSRTFSNFERTIYGRVPTDKEREFLWDSIIFYNYLQYAQSGPTRPLEQTKEAYKESEFALKEILETYLPDYVIAWGMRLYEITPDWDGELSVIDIEDKGRANVWTYTINGKRIPALFIHHPCYGGFSWSSWHPFIKIFLSLDDMDIPTEQVQNPLITIKSNMDIPMWLAHKPIIAVNYEQRDIQANVAAGDAKYLSIGRSTWDNNTISAKIWRESDGRWSRQSEDIPLWRLLDLAILFAATLKDKRSILGEILINETDEQFLKENIKENEGLYRPRIEELARLLQ